MAIQFTCTNPSCGRSIHAPDTAAGKKARCPKCGQVLTVPSADGAFPSVGGESLPASKPAPQAAARRMMVNAPPTLQKPMNKRPFIAAGIVLLALGVVVAVVMMAIKGNDKKASPPAQSPQVAQPEANNNVPPKAPVAPVAPVAPAPKAAGNPPAGVAVNPPATPNNPAPVTPSATPPNNSSGSSESPKQMVATPGVGVTAIEMPGQYTGALLDSRGLGQRAKALENMRLVRDAIIAYTITADKFPASWSDLTKGGGLNPDATKSGGDPKKNFVLVSGQTQSSPKTNILAYDPYPYVRTSMVILEVEGSPTFINIDDLKKRLKEQGAKPDEMPE